MQDRVFDGGEHESYILGIRGAREMRIDDFVRIWVQVDKHFQDEFSGRFAITFGTLQR